METLFWAYFMEGLALNDHPSLLTLAAKGGIPALDSERLMTEDKGRIEVLEERRGPVQVSRVKRRLFVLLRGRVSASG